MDLYIMSLIVGLLGLWQSWVASEKTYKAGDGSAGMFNSLWASFFFAVFLGMTFVQVVQHAIN